MKEPLAGGGSERGAYDGWQEWPASRRARLGAGRGAGAGRAVPAQGRRVGGLADGSGDGRESDSFYRDRWSYDKVVRSTHGVNCTGSCSWKVYVKDGIITWEAPRPDRAQPGPAAARFALCQAACHWYLSPSANVLQPSFHADVLSNAEDQGFGLLTTWDLFRIVRGFLSHGWRHDDVGSLFVAPGRILPVPAHYEFIGAVNGYWPQASALGLRLQSGVLHIGDRLAHEQPVEFTEEVVTSLQLQDQDVEEAPVGDHVGLKTTLTQHRSGRRWRGWAEEFPAGSCRDRCDEAEVKHAR